MVNTNNVKTLCTICCEEVEDLKGISVAKCGHTMHSRCLQDYKGRMKCWVSSCHSVIEISSIIKLHPYMGYANNPNDKLHEESPNTKLHERRTILCIICNDPVAGSRAIATAKCGHISHLDCAKFYIVKKTKCGLISCTKTVTWREFVPILPILDIQEVDHQHPNGRREVQETPQVKQTVWNLIQKSFSDPSNTISYKEAQDLKKNIDKLENTGKWKSFLFEDFKSTADMQLHCKKDEVGKSQIFCRKCEKHEKKIQRLESKMKTMKELKTRYYKENKSLKEQNKFAISEGISAISKLREANLKNAQNAVKINELTEKNADLQQEMLTLQSNAAAATDSLQQANAQILEMNQLRENNEQLQQEINNLNSNAATASCSLQQAREPILEMNQLRENIEQLQQEIQNIRSQRISDRDDSIRNEALLKTEIQDLSTRNERLTTENADMKTDLASLKTEFVQLNCTITDCMINEAQVAFDNNSSMKMLNDQIDTLKEANNTLTRYNQHLRKENDYYQRKFNITHPYDQSPGTRTSET